jgi:hypothetical protein
MCREGAGICSPRRGGVLGHYRVLKAPGIGAHDQLLRRSLEMLRATAPVSRVSGKVDLLTLYMLCVHIACIS